MAALDLPPDSGRTPEHAQAGHEALSAATDTDRLLSAISGLSRQIAQLEHNLAASEQRLHERICAVEAKLNCFTTGGGIKRKRPAHAPRTTETLRRKQNSDVPHAGRFLQEHFKDKTVGGMIENSIKERTIKECPAGDFPVTFKIVEQGSKRGKVKLIDSNGYSYNIKSRGVNVVYWQCSVRPKGNPCRALVMERSTGFQSNSTKHNHQSATGTAAAAEIMVTVKAEAGTTDYDHNEFHQ